MLAMLSLFFRNVFTTDYNIKNQHYRYVNAMWSYGICNNEVYFNQYASKCIRFNKDKHIFESVETPNKTCFLNVFAFPKSCRIQKNNILSLINNSGSETIIFNSELSNECFDLCKRYTNFCSISYPKRGKQEISIYLSFLPDSDLLKSSLKINMNLDLISNSNCENGHIIFVFTKKSLMPVVSTEALAENILFIFSENQLSEEKEPIVLEEHGYDFGKDLMEKNERVFDLDDERGIPKKTSPEN